MKDADPDPARNPDIEQQQKWLQRLAKLDCCAVSDALDASGLPPAVTGLVPLTLRRRIVGTAVTVKLGPAAGGPGTGRHLGTAAVEQAGESNVIVVEHRSRDDCAGWGGILSTGASLKGIPGVVVDGSVRDVDEAIELEFPVYARRGVAVTALGRVRETEFNGPVQIGDVEVAPGDFVIADSSGVAFVPVAAIDTVLGRAEKIAERERLMVEEVRQGRPITEVMGTNYEKMLETV